MANIATQVNRSPILPPKYRFLRFAPYYTATGKLNRFAQFKATYSCTMEFHYSPFCGKGLFMTSQQYFRNACLYDDPYKNCQADPSSSDGDRKIL